MITSGCCLWVIVVVDCLLHERRKYIVVSPGFGDNGEGSNGPDILDAQSNSVLPFLIQRLHSGFLKSLDGAHVAWGTVLTTDMENVGIFQQYSIDLLICPSKKRTRILMYNVIWVPEVVFYTFLHRMLYAVLAYRYTLSIVYPKCLRPEYFKFQGIFIFKYLHLNNALS